jgi:hypothetical protein
MSIGSGTENRAGAMHSRWVLEVSEEYFQNPRTGTQKPNGTVGGIKIKILDGVSFLQPFTKSGPFNPWD